MTQQEQRIVRLQKAVQVWLDQNVGAIAAGHAVTMTWRGARRRHGAGRRMSDNVVALGSNPITSERRRSFMEAVAQSYEAYIVEHGYEPEALVYVLAGTHQASHIAWHVEGQSQSGVVSVLSLAAVHCLTEAGQSRQGLAQS